MPQEERLRLWIEQGNVHISQLFFHHYKDLGINETDAMLILQMEAFKAGGVTFPTPADFSKRMSLTENEVSMILQKLMQRGYLSIEQNEDSNGVLYESFSLYPLWNLLLDHVAIQEDQLAVLERKEEEGELFKLFEQEFGRFLSPMECETVSMWLDQDGHSVDIIRAALKEAVLAQKLSLRYIDRILFEWKKKNIRTVSDAEHEAKTFRSFTMKPKQTAEKVPANYVPFYNWLEERD